MHINSALLCFFLTFAVVLIHARIPRFDYFDRLEDEFLFPEQHKQVVPTIDRNLLQSPLFTKRLFSFMTNEPNEHERLSAVGRRSKAITKGDPREFMG